MENRYWLLILGLVFVILGSKTGFAFVRAVYHKICSLFWFAVAFVLRCVSAILWRFGVFLLSLKYPPEKVREFIEMEELRRGEEMKRLALEEMQKENGTP